MGHNSVISGHPNSIGISWVDWFVNGTPEFWGVTLSFLNINLKKIGKSFLRIIFNKKKIGFFSILLPYKKFLIF